MSSGSGGWAYSSSTYNTWLNTTYVTVPSTGKYLINYTGRLALTTGYNDWWKMQLYDSTTSTVLDYTFGGYANDSSASGSVITSTLNAGDTIYLQYYVNQSSGTNYTFYYGGDGNGLAKIVMTRVSN